ncbi:hypothetical protein V565_163890 [Rhizoctonia solani 123E]|uniref:Uncharacterized protein n=1 Tax=Rhizoctonia solani 123E TaxID=1423351 RepID=A0A074SB20_9AGAM|nr:hypothetical protein V565_163890 [Rhizoctonia solani 123E]
MRVNKKATNQVESSKESSAPNQSSSSKSKSTDKDDSVVGHTAPSKGDNNTTNKKSAPAQPVDESDDEENWQSEPVAIEKSKPKTNSSTKTRQKGAPSKPNVSRDDKQHEDEESDGVEDEQTAKLTRPKTTPEPASKGKQKAAPVGDSDSEGEDQPVAHVTKPADRAIESKGKATTRPKRKATPTAPTPGSSDGENEDETAPKANSTHFKSVARSTADKHKHKRKASVVENTDESESEATSVTKDTRPKSKGTLTDARNTFTGSTTVDDDKSPAFPSGQGLKRKHTELDEDGLEHVSSRATSPTTPTVRDVSPELPSAIRDASPALTERFPSSTPEKKKRKSKELAQDDSESWEANVEAEIAKLETNNRDAKKHKPSNKSSDKSPPKVKPAEKSARSKKGARQGDPDESTQKAPARKRPILRQPRKDRDSEDIFTVTRKTKEELVEAIDVGGSERYALRTKFCFSANVNDFQQTPQANQQEVGHVAMDVARHFPLFFYFFP